MSDPKSTDLQNFIQKTQSKPTDDTQFKLSASTQDRTESEPEHKPKSKSKSKKTRLLRDKSKEKLKLFKRKHVYKVMLSDGTTIETRQGYKFTHIIDKERGLELDLVKIPAGVYLMGSPDDDEYGDATERPAHWVSVKEFYITAQPIKNKLWDFVALELPKIEHVLTASPKDQQPDDSASYFSWLEAVEFAKRLSKHTGYSYNLPSEAQWEYAVRAGRTLAETRKMPVNDEVSNEWGLGKVQSNLWEWMLDDWHDDYVGAPNTCHPWLDD